MSRQCIEHYHLRPLIEFIDGKWEYQKHYAIDWYGGNGYYIGNLGQKCKNNGNFINLTHKEAVAKIRRLRRKCQEDIKKRKVHKLTKCPACKKKALIKAKELPYVCTECGNNSGYYASDYINNE